MKLFMMLYVAGKVGGVWGPLPYQMAECQERAIDYNGRVEASFAKHRDDAEVMAKWQEMGVDGASDVRWVCEHHDTRPEADEF